jgi:hypothetical protein
MLYDTTPSEPENLVKTKTLSVALPGEALDEPEPPQPFDYMGN